MPRLNSRGCFRRDLPGCRMLRATRTQAQAHWGARTEPSRAFRLGWFDGFLQPTRCSHNGAPMPRTGNRGLVCVANSPLAAQASASSCSAVQCSVGWARVGVGVGCAVAGCQVPSANNDHSPVPVPIPDGMSRTTRNKCGPLTGTSSQCSRSYPSCQTGIRDRRPPRPATPFLPNKRVPAPNAATRSASRKGRISRPVPSSSARRSTPRAPTQRRHPRPRRRTMCPRPCP